MEKITEPKVSSVKRSAKLPNLMLDKLRKERWLKLLKSERKQGYYNNAIK